MRSHLDDGRLRGWRAGLIWAALGLDLGLAVAIWLAAGAGPDTPAFAPLLFVAMVSSLGAVGALVATRKPDDPVGWILLAAALMVSVAISGEDYVRLSVNDFGGELPLTVAIAWLYPLTFLPAVIIIAGLMPLYFPDGRLPSPRWRWEVWLAGLGIVITIVPTAFAPGPLASPTIQNPLGIPGFHELDGLLALSNLVVSLIVLPTAIASLIFKYRRGSPTVRAQLKWFALVALVAVAGFTAAVVGIAPIGDLGWLVGLIGLLLLPIAIGIAILRYHLYEIDRIVSRTIAYLVVTGVLAIVFIGAVLAFRTILEPFIGTSPVAVAASTLVVATLFQPLRSRVQAAVDRRFDRARYDADRAVAAFAERLRDGVDLASVHANVDAVVRETVAPMTLAIWMRSAESGGWPR
jgi:MFS family permease